MTALLASVRTLREAAIAVAAGCDWLDLKEPKTGALGALPVERVATIVSRFRGRLPISATIGDCWETPELIPARVNALIDTGIDYVKLGLHADRLDSALEDAFRAAVACMPNLIAVCFVETMPTVHDISRLAAVGFKGIMLDTADKTRGALTTRIATAALGQFVADARTHDLLVGLAGSLRAGDIAKLLPLQADYLGFRGALCRDNQRTALLDPESVRNIRRLISPNIDEESTDGMARTQIRKGLYGNRSRGQAQRNSPEVEFERGLDPAQL